jgi:hypothetical protein
MTHQDQDDLEQLLHSALDDYSPIAPERLWTGIEAKLPERRHKRLLWWLIWGVAGVGVWSGLAYRRGGNANEAKPFMRPTVAASETEGVKMAKNNVCPAPSLQVHATGSMAELKPITTRMPEAVSSISLFQVACLEGLATPIRPASDRQPITERQLPLSEWIQPVRSKRPISAGLASAPVWIWQQNATVTSNSGHGPAFVEHSGGPAKGWQTGFALEYAISSKWRIGAGLSRRTTSQELFHSATLRLMDGVCLNPYSSGLKNYEFQYALRSGAGATDVTVRIAQADSTSHMGPGEPFTLNMKTTRENTDWMVPITVARRFGHGLFRGTVRGGISLEIPGKTAIQVNHFSEACVDLCFASGHIPSITAARSGALLLQYEFGGGIDCQLTPRLRLSIEPMVFGRKGQAGATLNSSIFYRL